MNPELLERLRVRIGLEPDDTSKDAEIEAAWDAARLWLEAYLNRSLVPGDHTEVFTHDPGRVYSLRAYPVDSVIAVTGDSGQILSAHHIEKQNGLLWMDGYTAVHELTVEYSATPPSDGPVFLAWLATFDSVWAAMSTSTTTTPGGTTGTVKARSIDGMRTEYFDPNSGGGMSGIEASSGLPSAVAAMLHPYRREYV